MTRTRSKSELRQYGLTIVELLVALVMGLVLLGGVITVFVANKETYRVQDSVARGQETGRFILALLTRDLQRAGFGGCDTLAPRDPPRNALLGAFVVQGDHPGGLKAAGDSRWYGNNFYTLPIEAFEVDRVNDFDFSATSSGWDPALDRHFNDGPPVSIQPTLGSDILLVRVPDGDVLRVDAAAPPALSSDPITVFGGSDLKVNDVLLVSDCEYAAIFQATAVTHSGSRTVVTPNGDLGKKFPSLTTPADVQRYRTTAYYVAPTPTPESIAACQVSLYDPRCRLSIWRWSGAKRPPSDPNTRDNAVELAEGVENLQVRFGVDDNADGAVDRYEGAEKFDPSATNPAEWENVISARLTIVVRSRDNQVAPQLANYVVDGTPVTPLDPDRRLRQVFTATVTLRNRIP